MVSNLGRVPPGACDRSQSDLNPGTNGDSLARAERGISHKRHSLSNAKNSSQVSRWPSDLMHAMDRTEIYASDQLNAILLTATPEQLEELRHISQKYDLPMNEVFTEILKLIDLKFPFPTFQFSDN
jgi:type II secretory pathway component GspD/PulD (secretin)